MTEAKRIPLSVLDTVPVFEGGDAGQALRNALELAPHVERLGYARYWFAEHHNTPGLATSSPGVLIGRIAALTESLRVGAGGVMLPNHAPLAVAEQFGTLEALHPGRIDLGLGRAPGTDPATARLLRRTDGAYDFPRAVAELLGYFAPDGGGGQAPIQAVPAPGHLPETWLLGSSPNGARLAGALGAPFAYAYHFNPMSVTEALDVYRASFRPSPLGERPRVLVAVFAAVADTDAEADWLAGSVKYGIARAQQDPRGLFPTPAQAAEMNFAPAEQAMIRMLIEPQWVGSPETVRQKARDLLRRTGADELMAMTTVHDHAARARSYELLADALAAEGIGGREDAAASVGA
ncbi:MsnO8 family LLM class oxidoreductase [Streptomyces sp. 3MP-14]|uniref:MsnO8 family LLM class oxidoreductase n=1 Tax=Streptomyces mimosae TaxID=2586635 RepID=A0A5N5ZSU6_9ACTN|nr:MULTISPECIES: LLM class flavin-dependent oxidoreductase [Streptomyces]KAB8159581.1 MsnO8 family LLM class oxidoreductase [Streptomyces mimosae]KAB8172859.1 MsnO8 family LLM class oxidoreductase [Streptomyces sp. 3MP-14]